MIYDVIIAGAGPSGMTAAICASDAAIYSMFSDRKSGTAKQNILLLEKNKKIGKKLYATGNGRCNLSNKEFYLGCYDSENEFFPYKVIGAEGYRIVNQFIQTLGVAVDDENGYFYPSSRQASAVVWAFTDRLKQNGIQIHTGETVLEITKQAEHLYQIRTDKASYRTRNVILACGGPAAPKLGGTKDGCMLLDQLGIPYHPFRPALCKLRCQENLTDLSGVRCRASAAIETESGEEIANEQGEVQFTDTYISGIAVFNLSHIAGTLLDKEQSVFLKLSLVPELNTSDLIAFFSACKETNAERSLLACLNGVVHEKIAAYILSVCNLKNKKAGELSEDEIRILSETIKNLKFTITGTADFEDAQVAKGGADTRFLNPETMEVTVADGIYLIGEVVDVNGICGGYNLMWAIRTGMKAGFKIYDSDK